MTDREIVLNALAHEIPDYKPTEKGEGTYSRLTIGFGTEYTFTFKFTDDALTGLILGRLPAERHFVLAPARER